MTTMLTPDPGDDAARKPVGGYWSSGPGFVMPSKQADGARSYAVNRVDIKLDDGTIVGTFASIDFDARSKADSRDPSVRTYLGRLAVTSLLAHVSALRAQPLLSPSPEWLTGVAVFLAGQKRKHLAEEWRDHLSGWPDRRLSRDEQVRAALGFVWTAVRSRLRDIAASAWSPADAVLRSRTLSNLFVWAPVALVLVAIVRHDGRFGLVADIQDPAALGAFLYGVIRTGRWYRDVKPPEPKARHAGMTTPGEGGQEDTPEG